MSDTETNFELEEDEYEEKLDFDSANFINVLDFDEAAQTLDFLGKDQSGLRYAYLLIAPINRNLTDISVITQFKHILFVNISGNRLSNEAIQCLAQLPFLLLIQCDRNKIKSAVLNEMKYLQVLTFNLNLIQSAAGIRQPLLECLELNCNQITDIAELNGKDVPSLKILEVRSNLIETLNPLNFTNLDSLYLGSNKINKIVDLSQLINLRILHLRNNKIAKLRGFSPTMAKLQYINLRENCIGKLVRFQQLRCLPKLDTLIFIKNPVMANEENEEEEVGEEETANYRLLVLRILPKLVRINKEMVTDEERDDLVAYENTEGEFVMEEESSDENPVMSEKLNVYEEEGENYYLPHPDQRHAESEDNTDSVDL